MREKAAISRLCLWLPADDLRPQMEREASGELAFKHHLWMREPGLEDLSLSTRLPDLAALIKDFSGRSAEGKRRTIGQGYQPYHGSDSASSSSYYMSKF